MATETAEPETLTRRLGGPALTLVMGALMLSLLLEALDQTVVGTAMPRIIAKLHGFDRYTWAVTAYLLASTVMIPIAGKLSDQFGRKPFLLGGTAVFLAGSALCGAAQTINQLIVFRAVQGAGAGAGISLVFTAVANIFPAEERARWQGVLGSVYGISSVAGPTLGGWLAEHGPLLGALVTNDTRWRWVFYVNLPVGIVALAALLISFPADLSARSSPHRGWAMARRIDLAGAGAVAGATVSLLVGLTWVGEGSSAWSSRRVELALLAAVLLYAAFLLTERGALDPILPLGLFQNRAFTANALLTLFLWMALFGIALFVPLFLQGVLGASPTAAGAAMTPFSISIVAGNSLAGAGITLLGRCRPVTVLGAAVMAAGAGFLAQMTPATVLLQAAGFVVVAGLGMGILFTATSVAVQNTLPANQLGAGFGAVRYLGQMGGVLGAALVGTAVNNSLRADLARRLSSHLLRRLASQGITFSAGPQALITPAYRQTVIRAAVTKVTAGVPSGPHHAAAAAAAGAQELRLLNGVFAQLKLSLATAIQHGLLLSLGFCAAALLAAFLLRDARANDPDVDDLGQVEP